MPSDFSLQEPQPYFGGGGGVEWAQKVDALCGREQGPGKLVPAGESTGTAVNLSRHFSGSGLFSGERPLGTDWLLPGWAALLEPTL